MLTIIRFKIKVMINYIAHWEKILLQSRSEIVINLETREFKAICPLENKTIIEEYYMDSVDWKIDRTNFIDFSSIINLTKILKKEPLNSVFHIFTLKSGFYFMISNMFLRKNFHNILSITGLGFLFSKSKRAFIIKIFLRPLFIYLINDTFQVIIFQNSNDKLVFEKYTKYKNRSEIVPGSGINVNQYKLKNTFNEKTKIIFAGRLLIDKGVKEFIKIAESMNSSNLEFYLAGEIDKGNPKSISEIELESIKNNTCINYLGYIDIKNELKNYDILLSLSEHEGFSRILLEAAYVGLFCVAYNNPGIDFLSELENTEIFFNKHKEDIILKLNTILKKEKFISIKNRNIIENKYSTDVVASYFEKIYRSLNE